MYCKGWGIQANCGRGGFPGPEAEGVVGKKKEKKKKRDKGLAEPEAVIVDKPDKAAKPGKEKSKKKKKGKLAADMAGEDRLALLGRVLDYVLNQGLLDDDVVDRWGRKCLSKGELAALALETESDKLPPAKPIRLRTDLYGGKPPRKKR